MTGSIYDLGYRGYDGPRLGRRHAVATLVRHSTRTVFGLGRSGRSKILPTICVGLPALVAVVLVGTRAFVARLGSGEVPGLPGPDGMYSVVSAYAVLFVAGQAPELLGRDRRYRVLTLYFSRALRRTDYALARLAGLSIGVLSILVLPQLILAVGTVLMDPDIVKALGNEGGIVLPVLGSAAIISVATAALALAVASLTPRRAYATAAIFGVFIIPGIVAGIIGALELGDLSRWIVVIDIGSLLDGVNAWFFNIPPHVAELGSTVPAPVLAAGAVVIGAASAAALVWRYLRMQA